MRYVPHRDRSLRRLMVGICAVVIPLTLAPGRVAPSHAAPGDCTAECYVDAASGDDAVNHGTSPGDAFKTIQKALDTVIAGGTVHVAPGLYEPNFTEVRISATLLGAQAGVDPTTRDASDPSSESIVQSNVGMRIVDPAAEVTIDGFSFREKTVGQSVGISTASSTSDAIVTIESNIFSALNIAIAASSGVDPASVYVTGNLFSGGKTGVSASGDHGPAALAIDANRFVNATGSAVSLLVWSGAMITDNTIQSQSGTSDPIFVGGCADCTISGNVIADSGGFESISLIGSNGPSTSGTITGNSIINPTRADNFGIFVGIATGTTISGNTITGAREAGIATDPASAISGNTVTSLGGAGTTGIYLRRASTGSTVTGNTVVGAAVGIDIDPQAGSADTHINRNAITGNTAGLTNRAATLADATCNWWGDASGPGGQGPGSGDSVSANVTFSPWLLGADLVTAVCGVPPTPTPIPTATSTPTATPSATPLAEICDNCIDDDGDTLVDRDDADCPQRADGFGVGVGVGDARRAKAVTTCQKALGTAGTSFARKKQKILIGCVAGVQKCLQLKPGQASCVVKTGDQCARSVAKIAGIEAKLTAAVQKSCGAAVTPDDLLGTAGLGFAAEADSCAGFGVPALESAADVALCLVRRQSCAAERLLGLEAPRARELLQLAGIAPAQLGCIATGADGGHQGIGDAARGKALIKCEAGIERAAATYVKQQAAGLSSCIDAVTKCIQQKATDARCLPKAQARCAMLGAKLGGAKGPAARTRASIAKACVGDVNDVVAVTGLGLGSSAARCSALGVPTVESIADVAECLVRDHRCRVGQLLDAAIPRAAEMLLRGGIGG